MQIDQNRDKISTPFTSQDIAFSMVGKEEMNPVLKLLEQEKTILSGKESIKWQEEYARGRMAGREALIKLGAPRDSFIMRGESGEPLWPKGFLGSISHSGGMGVACVSRAENYLGLGIDLENYKKKRQLGIFKKIATEHELAWISEDESEVQKRGVLIFSIKESIYKAVYQAFKIRLTYMDAEVSPNLEHGEARVKIIENKLSEANIFAGFMYSGDYVVSGVALLA